MRATQAMHEDLVSSGLREIEDELRKMVNGEVEPYSAGCNVWGKAMSLAPEPSDVMWPLWLIWGALTDWVEVKPEEEPRAAAVMLCAAQEWLALDDDPCSRTAYLDRWVYDELGYARRDDRKP